MFSSSSFECVLFQTHVIVLVKPNELIELVLFVN
jgi:hypothetical protein